MGPPPGPAQSHKSKPGVSLTALRSWWCGDPLPSCLSPQTPEPGKRVLNAHPLAGRQPVPYPLSPPAQGLSPLCPEPNRPHPQSHPRPSSPQHTPLTVWSQCPQGLRDNPGSQAAGYSGPHPSASFTPACSPRCPTPQLQGLRPPLLPQYSRPGTKQEAVRAAQ